MAKFSTWTDALPLELSLLVASGGQFGIPFYAIFDEDEVMIIDSESPLGNVIMAVVIACPMHQKQIALQLLSKSQWRAIAIPGCIVGR